MVHTQALHLVERQQDTSEEELVFFLERKSEAIDDRSKNFQKLRNTVKTLGLVGKLEEDIVDGTSDV